MRVSVSERKRVSVCMHYQSVCLIVSSALVPKAALTQRAPIWLYLGIPEMGDSSKFNTILFLPLEQNLV